MANPAPAMVAPFFIGAPWAPKFSGHGLDFNEWQSNMQAILRAQVWTEAQQCDFVLSTLEGEARREVLILEENERATPAVIFWFLNELYGDREFVGSLRSLFFDCRQKPAETVRAYALRLRELGKRLHTRDPQTPERMDVQLRDQFVSGLQPGAIRSGVRRQLRETPDLTFARIRQLALDMEMDQMEGDLPESTVASVMDTRAVPNQTMDWKAELKEEILQAVKGHIRDTIQQEFQRFCYPPVQQVTSPHSSPISRQHYPRSPTPHQQRRDRRPSSPSPSRPHQQERHRSMESGGRSRVTFRAHAQQHNSTENTTLSGLRWDEQGRPICKNCGVSGHLARECTRQDLNY